MCDTSNKEKIALNKKQSEDVVINKSENQELTSLLEAYTEHCRRSNKLEDERKRTVEKLEKEIDYLKDQFTKEINLKDEQIKHEKVEQD